MMAWQRRSENQVLQNRSLKDERQRNFGQHVLTRFHEYDKAKMPANSRPGPKFQNGTVYEMENWLNQTTERNLASISDVAWIIARQFCSDDQKIPICGAFNEVRCLINPSVTTAGMLPRLQAPADDNNTIITGTLYPEGGLCVFSIS